MAYDTNTIGLFIDRSLTGILAFPNGTIDNRTGKLLVIGAWVDTVRNAFEGEIAGFQWMADIPANYELAIDNARDNAPWHISYKYEDAKSKYYLGTESKKLRYDNLSKCFIQEYTNGWILYNTTVGAFEIHGAIWARYKILPGTKKEH